MLDRLAPVLRHAALLIIMALATALTEWLGTDATAVLQGLPYVAPFAGAIVTILLAILTPLVRQYGVGSPVSEGDRGDSGSARTVFAALVGFVLAGILVVATLLAGPAEARRPAEHVATNGAQVCGSTLLVAFSLERLDGRAWAFRQDDGTATVQLRHQGAAAGPGGHWETYPAASGGEGHLRVAVAGLPYWDAVRVVHGGIASSPRLPVECAA